MDPQQELFTALRRALIDEFGQDKVYDTFLPSEDTPYPFVYLADSFMVDIQNKTKVNGTVSQTIHVWHNNPGQRGTVSSMMLRVKSLVRHITETGNYGWFVRNMSQRIITDNTTKAPLLHGVVEVDFYFS